MDARSGIWRLVKATPPPLALGVLSVITDLTLRVKGATALSTCPPVVRNHLAELRSFGQTTGHYSAVAQIRTHWCQRQQ